MENSLDQFLDKVKELSSEKYDVYVHSKKKTVEASGISFKQQKDLIATIADGVAGAVLFQKALNDIVLANVEEDLLITDRLGVIIPLRVVGLGETVNVDGQHESISNALLKLRDAKYTLTEVITEKGLKIVLEIPTIKYENSIIGGCVNALKREKADNFGSQLNVIYTYEIIKFIKEIQFDDNTLPYQTLPLQKKIEIIEKLPMSLNKKILSFIQKIKTEELEIKKTNNGNPFEIDVSFFDV